MEEIVVYVHGKGGSAQEAEYYKTLFPNCEVIGFDYHAQSPWEATEEFSGFFTAVRKRCGKLTLVANSIGAFLSLSSLNEKLVDTAYFISPVVDMEQLICNMMQWADVSEAELAEKLEISTTFGETLSWKYLCYVREHPVSWKIPTRILYGEKDALTSMETIKAFAEKNNAELTVMPSGEHWFHTKEQMQFLDNWIKNRRLCKETENKDGLASPTYSSENRAGADGLRTAARWNCRRVKCCYPCPSTCGCESKALPVFRLCNGSIIGAPMCDIAPASHYGRLVFLRFCCINLRWCRNFHSKGA